MYKHDMYKYKHHETELKLLVASFKENKRLYFFTRFGGVLLYFLVLWFNFYWNPFFRAAFDVWGENTFEKLVWSNFYLTFWYALSLLFV